MIKQPGAYPEPHFGRGNFSIKQRKIKTHKLHTFILCEKEKEGEREREKKALIPGKIE